MLKQNCFTVAQLFIIKPNGVNDSLDALVDYIDLFDICEFQGCLPLPHVLLELLSIEQKYSISTSLVYLKSEFIKEQ